MKHPLPLVTLLTFFAVAAGASPEVPPSSKEDASALHLQLQDGTQVQLDADGSFYILNGNDKIPAPDGTHTLKDGSTLSVRNGKKIS